MVNIKSCRFATTTNQQLKFISIFIYEEGRRERLAEMNDKIDGFYTYCTLEA
jgi:hypothetical protein